MTIFDNIPSITSNTFEDIRNMYANDIEYEMVIERLDKINNRQRKY